MHLTTSDWLKHTAEETGIPRGYLMRRVDAGALAWVLEQAREGLIMRRDPCVVAARAWVGALQRGVLPGRPEAGAESVATLVLKSAGHGLGTGSRRRAARLARALSIQRGSVRPLSDHLRRHSVAAVADPLEADLVVLAASPVRGRSPTELTNLGAWHEETHRLSNRFASRHGLHLKWNRPEDVVPLGGVELWGELCLATCAPPGLAILLEDGGGATGVGIATEMLGRRTIIVHLRPRGTELSRQVEALAEEAQLVIRTFRASEGPGNTFQAVLDEYSEPLAKSAARSYDRARWGRLILAWRARWKELDDRACQSVIDRSGLRAERVVRLLTDPGAMWSAKLDELERLGQALDRPLCEYGTFERPTDLDELQEAGLRTLARERKLSSDQVLDLRELGLRQMAATLERRLNWEHLYETQCSTQN